MVGLDVAVVNEVGCEGEVDRPEVVVADPVALEVESNVVEVPVAPGVRFVAPDVVGAVGEAGRVVVVVVLGSVVGTAVAGVATGGKRGTGSGRTRM